MIEIQPGEKVILEVRRHWFVLFLESLLLLVLFVAPILALGFFSLVGVSLSLKIWAVYLFVLAAWLLIIWILFFVVWTNYYLDVWLITDRRIIDVEQYRLFSREISEFRLDRIQDITIEIRGLIPTFLHFGDIHVQTAGQSRLFILKNVPHPDKVKDVIFKQCRLFLEGTKAE